MAERIRIKSFAGAMAVAMGLLGADSAWGQQPAAGQGPAMGTKLDETPAFNDWGARTFLIEVQPLVEKYTGWKHEALPAFKLVTRAEYAKSSMEEFQRAAAGLPMAGVMPSPAKMNSMLLAQSAGLLGRYSRLTKTIYLLPGNLKPAMRSLGLEDRFTRDLVEIVCAHEMTHAFQHERYPDRNFWSSAADEDFREAYAMLQEGHAVWVQEQVAWELKVEEAARQMIEKMANHEDAQTFGAAAVKASRRYTAGKRFLDAVFKRSGLAGVQRLFERPPRSPAAVLDPELYFATDGATAAAR